MKICSPELYSKYLSTFHSPLQEKAELIADGTVGLVILPNDVFSYNSEIGYAFEVAITENQESHDRLLLVRIDSFRWEDRRTTSPDYCIPMAYEGASERERLVWSIEFGGMWSDCREEAILIFDARWKAWLKSLRDGIAFTNDECDSAAYLQFTERELTAIQQF